MKPESTALTSITHASFYKFVNLADPAATVTALQDICAAINADAAANANANTDADANANANANPPDSLKGIIWVAPEGLNGMLAASLARLQAFEAALKTHAAFAGAFADVQFKHSHCITKPFWKLKIRLKPEVLPLGIDNIDARESSGNLNPTQWREMLKRDDVVLLDNRNSFEYRLGRFKGAIDPQVQNFRDFPKYIEANVAQWQAEGKTVAMYCTGGIRCEKTSAWMKAFNVPVVQLEGGILNYFLAIPDAEKDYEGECFVFDNRIAIDTKLQETATTFEQVYEDEPDGQWRIARAKRLHRD
jgi:UPF0176 protein